MVGQKEWIIFPPWLVTMFCNVLSLLSLVFGRDKLQYYVIYFGVPYFHFPGEEPENRQWGSKTLSRPGHNASKKYLNFFFNKHKLQVTRKHIGANGASTTFITSAM